jgi:hypothetical protein
LTARERAEAESLYNDTDQQNLLDRQFRRCWLFVMDYIEALRELPPPE